MEPGIRVNNESRFGATINRGERGRPGETQWKQRKFKRDRHGKCQCRGFLLHLELDVRGDTAGRADIVGKDGRGAGLVGELDKAERRRLGDLARRAVDLKVRKMRFYEEISRTW